MNARKWIAMLLFSLIATSSFTALAQQVRISGHVRDINSHQDIPSVNIYVKSSQVGTVTDQTGRFSLLVLGDAKTTKIVFQHVAFEILELSLDSLRSINVVYLQPRIIPLQGVEVSGEAIDRPEIQKDIPQTLAVVNAKDFEIRGYVDAGDLLRTDHSVQVEEDLSGKKTVAIRGGNADEVVVMYNGVKMNNVYDNVFDLSLIDLEDVQRFEIIKGSNTALYGPDAFSGVINIVPKTKLDYSLRFQQRVGTYRSGNWGLHVNPENLLWRSDRFNASYSYKRGGVERKFIDFDENGDSARLTNESTHHTASMSFSFDGHDNPRRGRSLNVMFIDTQVDYRNERDDETVGNKNRLYTAKFAADMSRFANYSVSMSYKELLEMQVIRTGTGFLDRSYDDNSIHFNAENTLDLGKVDWLFGYQYQRAELDFFDDRTGSNLQQIGLKSALLQREHHGLVSIAKLRNDVDAEFLQSFDLNLSVRHDFIKDTQKDAQFREADSGQRDQITAQANNDWRETIMKLSVGVNGLQNDFSLQAYMNFGTNVKFPTLFQQISLAEDPSLLTSRIGASANLAPEKNNSIELGAKLSRQIYDQPVIYGWSIDALYFQNHYDNKIVTVANVTSPVATYFSVPDASISGLELKPSAYLYKKKVTIGLGLSKYWISDKDVFPFKSDMKRTLSLIIDHAGYNFQALWFKEGEQIARLRQLDGQPVQVILPDYSNLDLHLSKTFTLFKIKLFANVSGRNLLNNQDLVLEGIALRDRRYYITVGSQF